MILRRIRCLFILLDKRAVSRFMTLWLKRTYCRIIDLIVLDALLIDTSAVCNWLWMGGSTIKRNEKKKNKREKKKLTVFREFSICSRCPTNVRSISAPWPSVSSAMLVDSAIRLEPSESVCDPAKSLVRSLLSPYGSSELRDPPVLLNAPRRSVRAVWECRSLESFLYFVKSDLACLRRDV